MTGKGLAFVLKVFIFDLIGTVNRWEILRLKWNPIASTTSQYLKRVINKLTNSMTTQGLRTQARDKWFSLVYSCPEHCNLLSSIYIFHPPAESVFNMPRYLIVVPSQNTAPHKVNLDVHSLPSLPTTYLVFLSFKESPLPV